MVNLFALVRESFIKLLDTAFPPSKRAQRVRSYSAKDISCMPQQHSAAGCTITTLVPYHTKAIEDAIRALKYERATEAADLLAQLLADYLLEQELELELLTESTLVLVPIPLAAPRMRTRGYNQVQLVLARLKNHGVSIPVNTHLLMRTRDTPQQTRLSRSERLKNVSGAFALHGDASVRGMHIILVDDVTTTGATLSEATRVLKKAGATVSPLALARA